MMGRLLNVITEVLPGGYEKSHPTPPQTRKTVLHLLPCPLRHKREKQFFTFSATNARNRSPTLGLGSKSTEEGEELQVTCYPDHLMKILIQGSFR